jgi:predicted P-loop ATPase
MSAFNPSCEKLTQVTKTEPCKHCGKPDWCYRLGELEVCNRDAEPATGWCKTSKRDKDGKPYYAMEQPKKSVRPKSRQEYVYTNIEGNPQIRVTVVRNGEDSTKKVYQQYWMDGWVPAKDTPLEQKTKCKDSVNWYRVAEIRKALSEDSSRPVFIVEGEGVADALWELGLLATTSIGGAGKFSKYGGLYNADLGGSPYQLALKDAQVIVLCPDRDKPGLDHMLEINKSFCQAKWLLSPPSEFYWTHLPSSGGLDVKDWIESGATVKDILSAIGTRDATVDSLNKSLQSDGDVEREAPAKTELKQAFNLIKSRWGSRLAWNEMQKQVELDGKKMPLDRIKLRICREFDLELGKEDCTDIIVELAMENSYNPVVKYLDSLDVLAKTAFLSVSPTEFLDGLASRYFGTTDPLHSLLLKRTLIAAVVRAYEPGEKVDTICILQGLQGAKKSTFWKELAGKVFFTDDISSGTEKDEIMKLSKYWMLEYAEFESAYRKKEVSTLKAFLSRTTDSIRLPYGKDLQDIPRPSIFVGTTNKTEFLHDPTGERRYWVIPVKVKKIDLNLLKKERDAIWAAAVQAYRNGELWYLEGEEEDMLKGATELYQASDAWEVPISNYLEGREHVTINGVLTECLQFDLNRIQKADEIRVAEILRRLQWDKYPNQRRIDGQRVYLWKPMAVLTSDIETGISQDIKTDAKNDTASFPEDVSQVSYQNSQNLPENLKEVQSLPNLKPEEHLPQSNKTDETPSQSAPQQEVETVSTPSQPETQFDAAAVAQGMVELLQEEDARSLLRSLLVSLTSDQKALIKTQLTVEQYQTICKVAGATNTVASSSPLPTPCSVAPAVGSWVRDRKTGTIFQVVGNSAFADRVQLENANDEFGLYPVADLEIISKGELLQKGLVTSRLRPWEVAK